MSSRRFHVIVDLSGVPSDRLTDAEGLTKFLKELPGVIEMSVLKGPEVAEGIPENPGLSGFVIIDFSHISVHTFTKYNEALVDIFSCKPYDQDVAIEAVLKFFQVSRPQARIQEVAWA